MHIGVITPEYPPYAAGGIGTATLSFVRNMASAGHNIHVFAIFQQDLEGYDPNQDSIAKGNDNDKVTIHYLSYKLDRDIFIAKEIEQKTLLQISKLFSLSQDAAKSRLKRTRANIKNALEKRVSNDAQ